MKKGIIILIACTFFLYQLSAQKPVIDQSVKTKVDPDQLKPLQPPPAKVAFSATISIPREIILGVDGNMLRRFDRIDFNDGNGFDALTGVFTTPATGYYCFIFNINYPNYGCADIPTSFVVTIVKNNEDIQTFYLPVWYGSGTTSEGFTMIVQLNRGDKLALRPLAPGCAIGGNRPSVNKIIFSGYKIN